MSTKLSQPKLAIHGRSFALLVSAILAVLMAAAMVLAGTAIYSATLESDSASAERQSEAALHALQMSVNELALQQESVAIWDESWATLTAPDPDVAWVNEWFGTWLHNMFGHDETYIIASVSMTYMMNANSPSHQDPRRNLGNRLRPAPLLAFLISKAIRAAASPPCARVASGEMM